MKIPVATYRQGRNERGHNSPRAECLLRVRLTAGALKSPNNVTISLLSSKQ